MEGLRRIVLSIILFLVVTMVGMILMIPAYIKHHLVLWVYGKPGDEILEGIDLICYGNKQSVINWMVEIKGEINLKELQTYLQEKCKGTTQQKLRKFRSFLVMVRGTMMWRKDPKFSIENHVVESEMTADDEEHLKEILQKCAETPVYHEDRSPWMVHLIPTREGNSVLFFMIGHSLTDGVGCMNLFNQVLTDSPVTIPQPKISRTLRHPVRIWNYMIGFLDTVQSMRGKRNKFLKLEKSRSVSTRSICWSKPVSLSQLLPVRQAMGSATIHDVTCGVIWQAVSHYVELYDNQYSGCQLGVVMAASLRMEKDYTPQNLVGLIKIYVAAGIRPIEEHINFFAANNRIKKTVVPVVSHYIYKCLTNTLSVRYKYIKSLSHYFQDSIAASVSNVPGPTYAVKMAGRDVRQLIFIPVPLSSSGISFSVSSYNGELRVGIHDYLGVADTSRLISLVDDGFEKLLETTQ